MVDFRCTSGMDFYEKHCVHLHSPVAGVRHTAAASLLRATLSFIYNFRDAHLRPPFFFSESYSRNEGGILFLS